MESLGPGLLQLQLEIEQIDLEHIAGLSEERLKHYNRVLAEQLKELQQEVNDVETHFLMEFGLDPYQRLKPAGLMRDLRADLQVLERENLRLTRELNGLRADPAAEGHSDGGAENHQLESQVDVHAFTPDQLTTFARGAGFDDVHGLPMQSPAACHPTNTVMRVHRLRCPHGVVFLLPRAGMGSHGCVPNSTAIPLSVCVCWFPRDLCHPRPVGCSGCDAMSRSREAVGRKPTGWRSQPRCS